MRLDLDKIYRTYKDNIYGIGFNYFRNPSDAEADATVGIYDADNNLVRNLTNEEVKSVDFTKDTQKCTIDGNEYRVCVLMTINSAGDTVSNQIRLYAPADYAKGVESINKDTTPAKSDEEGLVVVSPYVDVE